MRHLERAPSKEPAARREKAFEALRSINDQLEAMNKQLSEILAELNAVKDILRHAEATGAGDERLRTLRNRSEELTRQALAVSAAMKPLENAGEQISERHDIAEA